MPCRRHAEPCYVMPLLCMAALSRANHLRRRANHLSFTSILYNPTLCPCFSRPSIPLRSYASSRMANLSRRVANHPRCIERLCLSIPMPCPARLICANTLRRVPVIALPVAIQSFSYPSNPPHCLSMQNHCLACAFISFPSHCFALPVLHISGRACPINSRALRCSAPPMPSSANRIHVSSMLCRLIAQQVRGDHSSRTSVTLTAPSAWSCLRIRTGPL